MSKSSLNRTALTSPAKFLLKTKIAKICKIKRSAKLAFLIFPYFPCACDKMCEFVQSLVVRTRKLYVNNHLQFYLEAPKDNEINLIFFLPLCFAFNNTASTYCTMYSVICRKPLQSTIIRKIRYAIFKEK